MLSVRIIIIIIEAYAIDSILIYDCWSLCYRYWFTIGCLSYRIVVSCFELGADATGFFLFLESKYNY
jgi:hypothetical protein